MLTLSAVVPVYSGEEYLRRLITRFESLKSHWQQENAPISLAEVILVDDSAIDKSPELIDELAGEYPWVVALHLSRNYGQHAATIAGILHSSGDWVVTLDEDLQHPPEEIERLLRKAISNSSDIVYGKPVSGVHETMFRDFSSKTIKAVIEKLTGNPHIRNANSFRLLRGPVARAASSVCSHDTYFDIALIWFTNRVDVVNMEMKDARYIEKGKSGYNISALMSHARKLIFSSKLRILRLGALVGLIVVLFSAVGSVGLVVRKIMYPDSVGVAGWTSLMVVIGFFSGAILAVLGIVLEYLSILVLRAHGKPLFFTIDRKADTVLRQYFLSR